MVRHQRLDLWCRLIMSAGVKKIIFFKKKTTEPRSRPVEPRSGPCSSPPQPVSSCCCRQIHAHEPWSPPSSCLEALTIAACPRSTCLHRRRGETKRAPLPHRSLPTRGARPLHAVFSSSSSMMRPPPQPLFLPPPPLSRWAEALVGVDSTRTKGVGP
jgi:hypothetical protein